MEAPIDRATEVSIFNKINELESKENKPVEMSKGQIEKLNTILSDTNLDAAGKLARVTELYKEQCLFNSKMIKQNATAGKEMLTLKDSYTVLLQQVAAHEDIRRKMDDLIKLLQDKNKSLLEQEVKLRTEEATKRKELTDTFQTAIEDIQKKINEQDQERRAGITENEELREKMKAVFKQYELREEQYTSQMKQKSLEIQLEQAKAAQQAEILRMETEKNETLTAVCTTLKERETALQGQIEIYASKYSDFQDTLTQTNSMFETYQKQIKLMTKREKDLETERVALLKKTSSMDLVLVQLHVEKDSLQGKYDKLSELCKLLQRERKEMNAKLKSYEGLDDASSTVMQSVDSLKIE